jgi:hypothetical protein
MEYVSLICVPSLPFVRIYCIGHIARSFLFSNFEDVHGFLYSSINMSVVEYILKILVLWLEQLFQY